MAAQTREQGRYLGGRPPYGYRLADAGRIRTRRTPPGGGGRTAWSPTRARRRWCGGSSPSAWPGIQCRADRPRAERGRDPVPVRGRPRRNPHRTGARAGRCARSPRSWPTPATRAGRCGTGSAPTSSWSTRPTWPSGISQVQRWNLPEGGSSPTSPRTRRWSARTTSSPPRTSRGPRPGPAGRLVPRRYLLAGLLACGRCGRQMESAWSNGKPAYRCRHGCTSAIAPTRPARRTPTSARTSSCRTCPPCPPLTSPAVRARRRTRAGARCQEHREPGRGDRVPARARDHPHLEPGCRSTAGTRHPDCQDRHRDSTLTRLQSPDQEGRPKARNADRPALAAACARVTIRHARKQRLWGITVSEGLEHSSEGSVPRAVKSPAACSSAAKTGEISPASVPEHGPDPAFR